VCERNALDRVGSVRACVVWLIEKFHPTTIKPKTGCERADWYARRQLHHRTGRNLGPSSATRCGKTTITSLLMRFSCAARRVRIDGGDVRQMDLAVLRRRYGVVRQIRSYSRTVEGIFGWAPSGWRIKTLQRAPKTSSVLIHPNASRRLQESERARAAHFTVQNSLLLPRGWRMTPKSVLDEATSSRWTRTPNFGCAKRSPAWLKGELRSSFAHRLSTVQRADKSS